MPFANTSQSRIAAIEEVTWGTTPSSPAFDVLRVTGEQFNHDMETARSNEIRADRNVSDLIRLGKQASGSFDFELTYGTFDSLLESGLFGAWTTNVLKNGGTQKSFSFERTVETGATDAFFRFVGMIVDQITLSAAARQIITGNMSLLGKGGSTDTAIIVGATYTPVNDNEVLTASVDFSGLTMGGISPAPSVMSLEISLSNNLRGQPVVGSQELAGVGAGRFETSGRLSAYFEDLDFYLAFLNGTASSLLFTMGTITLEKYTVSIPTLKFETGQVNTPGNDQDVMAEMSFVGLYNAGISATTQITRAVA